MHLVIRELVALSRMSEALREVILCLRGEDELRTATLQLQPGRDGAAYVASEGASSRIVEVNRRRIAHADDRRLYVRPWAEAEANYQADRAKRRSLHERRAAARREVDAALATTGVEYAGGQEGGCFRLADGHYAVSARGALARAGFGPDVLDALQVWSDELYYYTIDCARLRALGVEVTRSESPTWSSFRIRIRDARGDLAPRASNPHRAPRTHAERREAEAW